MRVCRSSWAPVPIFSISPFSIPSWGSLPVGCKQLLRYAEGSVVRFHDALAKELGINCGRFPSNHWSTVQPDAFAEFRAWNFTLTPQGSALCLSRRSRWSCMESSVRADEQLRRKNVDSFEHKVRAAPNSKFLKQCRHMKFHGAFRDIQLCRDLLIA